MSIHKLSIPQLKNILKANKVSSYSDKRKPALIRMIKENKIKVDMSKYKFNHVRTNKYKNNEVFGITMEYNLCKEYNLENKLGKRTCRTLKNLNKYIKNVLKPDINKKIGKLDCFNGAANDNVDFYCKNKSISLKTTFDNRGRICPQSIGQPTMRTFIQKIKANKKTQNIAKKYKFDSEKITEKTYKNVSTFLSLNSKCMLDVYIEHTFCCDYLIWIYGDEKKGYNHFIISKKGIKKIHKAKIIKNKFSFSNNSKKWHSNTLKYNNVTIGEYQIHRIKRNKKGEKIGGRDNVKFKFRMYNLLLVLGYIKNKD